MDDDATINLEDVLNNPNYDFINKIRSYSDLQNNDRFINVNDSPYFDSNILCSYIDELQFYDKFKDDKRLSVMSLNVQSLPAKFNEFAEMISHMLFYKCEPDVICIQETWRIADPELYKIEGYQCPVFKIRESMQGGGVAIYVKDCYNFKVINEYSSSVDKVAETLFIEMISKDKNKFIFGSVYRTNAKYTSLSEKAQNEMFLDLISNILSNINETGSQAYIAGDFNIDVLKLNSNDFVDDYINNIFLNGFLQIISKPTRCTRHSATLLDHILTNDVRSSYESCIIVNKLSDHFPVVTFCTKNKAIKEQYVETRFINENSISAFKHELSQISWNDVIECQDTQLSFDLFLSNFLDLYNLFFPKTKVKLNRNIHKLEPWFTNGLLISRRKKLYLGKCAARNPTEPNVNLYKSYRNIYNSVIRNSKKLFYEAELEKHKNNLRVTWDILRRAIKKTKSKNSFISSLKVNGEEITDPKVLANCFNTFFTTIASDISDEVHPTVRPPEWPDNGPDMPVFDLCSNPVTNFELLTTVNELNSKKSEDYSGISMFFIKNLTLQLIKPLVHVINLSFKNGIVPNQMKIAKVVPIFKGGDTLSMDNYRPISLLSNFSKILEKVMCNRLTNYLESNKLISKYQFGFRKKHSTVHPILHLLNEVSEASSRKKYTLAIFCDLRKAFDTCDHNILIKKLKKLGVRGPELTWFISYLQGRMQFVTINGTNSDNLDINKGVPQGSILGPLLFLIYINDLPDCSLLITLLFADDTTLLASGDNLQDLVLFVNREFQKVVSFFRSHKMALHPIKTKFIIFNANEQLLSELDPYVYINSNNEHENFENLKVKIERININSAEPAIKFLGVYLDPKLNFKYHVSKMCKKIASSLYVINMTKNVLSSNALKSLYFALVHSHFIYGIHVWSAAPQHVVNSLEKMQKKAIRMINNAPYNSHTEPLFKKCKILPLNLLVKYFKLLFMYDYTNDLLPLSFEKIWLSNAERRNPEQNGNVNRNLRDDDLLYVPYVRLEQYLRFPLADLPRMWNNFNNVVVAPNRNLFKNLLKEHLLSSLSDVVTCNRLLCPACHLRAANQNQF
jgi:hypothetical protein